MPVQLDCSTQKNVNFFSIPVNCSKWILLWFYLFEISIWLKSKKICLEDFWYTLALEAADKVILQIVFLSECYSLSIEYYDYVKEQLSNSYSSMLS